MARDLAGKFTGKDGDKDGENENDENAEKDEAWDERLVRSNNARGVIRREPKANLSGGQIESLIRLQTSAKNKEDRPMCSNNTRSVIGREPAADPLGGLEEKQMDDALRGIKSAHGFDRLTKSADGEFWEVSAKKGDKKKTLEKSNVKKRSQSDLFSCEPKPTDFGCGCFEGKEQDEQAADPELEAKAQEGFAELRSKAAKYDGDGASLEEAQKVVSDVKKKHPVFKVLEVEQDEGDFDVRYSYNPEGSLEDVIDTAGKTNEEQILPLLGNIAPSVAPIGYEYYDKKADGSKKIRRLKGQGSKESNLVKLSINSESSGGDIGGSGAINIIVRGSKGSNRLSTPGKLAKSVGGDPENQQFHHLIPDAVVRTHPIAKLATDAGYDLDRASNGLRMPCNEIGQALNPLPIHNGSHAAFNAKIYDELETQKITAESREIVVDSNLALKIVTNMEIKAHTISLNSGSPLR